MSDKTKEILVGILIVIIFLTIGYFAVSFIAWNVHIRNWNSWLRFLYGISAITLIGKVWVTVELNIKRTKYEKTNVVSSIMEGISEDVDVVSNLFEDKLKTLRR